MAKPPASTTRDDAPEATAKDPNPAAAGLANTDDEDTLIGRTVTINRPRQALYEFWRDVRNIPLFMDNVVSITAIDDRRSRWVMKGPADTRFEWTSVITEDDPGYLIAWNSEGDPDVANTGRIVFIDSPNGRGTLVRVTLTYDAPGGALGKLVAKVTQHDPKMEARRALRRFKQLVETGELANAGSPVDDAR